MNNMLMILDGFGISSSRCESAILKAKTPNLDKLFSSYPHTRLKAAGPAVGLPKGQMGNSEVGHLNIGAGRVVYQDLTRISKEIAEGDFFQNTPLNDAVEHVLSKNSSLHLLGLLSDGGVHSHINHLFALLDMAKKHKLQSVHIHALLDGRDVPPKSAITYIGQLQDYIDKTGIGRISTVAGRYYAMDRDNRWERVRIFYEAITEGKGYFAKTAKQALEMAYKRGESDEFVLPTHVGSPGIVKDNDSIIMFNFRPDRAREITRCFTDENFNGFERSPRKKDLFYVCMTQYDAEMPNVFVAYPPLSLKNTLGEYISALGLKQLRIAETEKYAHVTFFLNGGIEAPYNGEDRILIPSPKVATYDLKPEMSACEITDKVITLIDEKTYDFIILNFANPDMVGHTGIMDAAVKAVEALDNCIGRIVKALLANEGQLILTSDHGNADCMRDSEGNPVTAHSLNPVPFLVIAKRDICLQDGGVLADIAPSLLHLASIEKPLEMTGHSLIKY